MTTIAKTVMNLTNKILDKHTLSILEKGLNFAVALKRIPVEEIITNWKQLYNFFHMKNQNALDTKSGIFFYELNRLSQTSAKVIGRHSTS